MLDLIGDDASGYLSAPAERSRWQDTWTMQRTRREAMAQLARTYGSWPRTLCGALATAVLLGGSYLLGRGVTGLAADGGVVAAGVTAAAVLLLLIGLAGAGYVLFTGTRLVTALRAWSSARAQDGGPGLRLLFTPAVVVRLAGAVVLLGVAVALVLVRTGVLAADADEPMGGALWQWFAAAGAAGSAFAALSGNVRTGLALRRRPGQPAPSSWQHHAAAPAGPGDQWGHAPAHSWAPQPVQDGPTAGAGEQGSAGSLDAGVEASSDTRVPAPAEEGEEEWAATRMVGGFHPAAVPLRARLSDGQLVAAEGTTLIGRSPAGGAGELITALIAVTDTAVSKTHLAVRIAEGRAWVTDRASTNGTVLLRNGAQESLTPWQEAALVPGDQLVLGATTLQIEPVDQQ